MENKATENLIKNGYIKIDNAIKPKIINESKKIINETLVSFLKKKNRKSKKTIQGNFLECRKLISQHEIQTLLAKKLVHNGIYHKILSEKKITKLLINLIGPDLEYVTNSELAINYKEEEDSYYVKKFHQEFWSGAGIASLLLWVPINLKAGMGTLEFIKNSHTWGHIPHSNREPIKLPQKFDIETIKAKEGSLLMFTTLTLHRTIINKSNEIRIAAPITVRNFYYPKIGNEDLWEFKKLNLSFFSKFRKILGNPQFSPFRTLNQKRKSIFDKEKIQNK